MYTRKLEKLIKDRFFKQNIIILYGPRQVGKTTLVKKMFDQYDGKKAYFQCDIVSDRNLFEIPEPRDIKKAIGDITLLIIDEAQLVENIGTTLKVLFDTYPDLQIIATGSASFDLANKIREPLTGRAYEFIMYPLSVEEIISEKGIIFFKQNESHYLRFGFYPKIIEESDMESIQQLSFLQNNTLYKDIFTLESIKKPKVLEKLITLLAFNIGSSLNINNIGREIGTADKTVERYLDLLEKMFVIVRLYGFSRNLSNEIKKGFKVYFTDIGMRNSIINNFNTLDKRNDKGALFENYFIIERLKYLSNNRIIVNRYFWKNYNQIEIDLIEERSGELQAIEVKYNEDKSRSFKFFEKEYENVTSKVVNKNNYLDFVL